MHPYSFEPSSSPWSPAQDDPRLAAALDALGRELDLGEEVRAQLLAAHGPLCRWIDTRRRAHGQTLVVGVHGAQGSGKTTFCRVARVLLERIHGWRVCGFSIDDFYLGLAERRTLAHDVHPLFATRGVPGTHEVDLGLDLLARLRRATDGGSDGEPEGQPSAIAIPVFDKARDDRAPRRDWPVHHGRADIVIFEGWCVGVRPQDDTELEAPINTLETHEDTDGTWRQHVNHRLATDYAQLFAQLDTLIVLQVPGFEHVRRWRRLQEEKLARRHPGAPGLLDSAALDRFLMHYERTTRHALATLPALADVVCRIDDGHHIARIDSREPLVS